MSIYSVNITTHNRLSCSCNSATHQLLSISRQRFFFIAPISLGTEMLTLPFPAPPHGWHAPCPAPPHHAPAPLHSFCHRSDSPHRATKNQKKNICKIKRQARKSLTVVQGNSLHVWAGQIEKRGKEEGEREGGGREGEGVSCNQLASPKPWVWSQGAALPGWSQPRGSVRPAPRGGRAAASPRCGCTARGEVSPGQVGRRFPSPVLPHSPQPLTFMSLMMVWKSPPSALHSFSITASIFLARAHRSRISPLPLQLHCSAGGKSDTPGSHLTQKKKNRRGRKGQTSWCRRREEKKKNTPQHTWTPVCQHLYNGIKSSATGASLLHAPPRHPGTQRRAGTTSPCGSSHRPHLCASRPRPPAPPGTAALRAAGAHSAGWSAPRKNKGGKNRSL